MAKTKKKGGKKDELKMTPKQIRARARRRQRAVDEELAELYKPIDEWTAEELAQGRPANDVDKDGKPIFRGRKPQWVTRQVHEEAIRRFTEHTQGAMRGLVPEALATVEMLLKSEEVDEKGRPIVPPSVKLQAAQWVVEHLVGKPKQRMEADISVRLQGILGTVLVNPADFDPSTGMPLRLAPAIDVESWEGDDKDDDSDLRDYESE